MFAALWAGMEGDDDVNFDELPSQETFFPWMFAEAPGRTKSVRSGKWLLFKPRDEIDEWWSKIEGAVRTGILGPSAKVSTAKERGRGGDSQHVICVYTRDHEDEDDVFRVRSALRELGVDWKIYYKTDDATLAGQYSASGRGPVSKFSR